MKIMENLYDCHTHLNLQQFDPDRESVIKESISSLEFMINVGFDELSCEETLSLAYRYDNIYAALGFHPTSAAQYSDKAAERLRKMVTEDKVIAIGEIGLDYYWMKDPETLQKKVFYSQMELAATTGLPVIIHDRDAHHDVINMLESFKGKVTGVLHSFSANSGFAFRAADLGYYFSVSGPVTFKNKKNDILRETISKLPADRILIETDCPYLAPHPLRGTINKPLNVSIIAAKVAELKNIGMEEFLSITRQNAFNIFGV